MVPELFDALQETKMMIKHSTVEQSELATKQSIDAL